MLPMALQFLIVMIASAINDRLQRKLDYLEEERRVLREQLDAATGGKKLSFTANQRRRLAEAGKLLTPEERRKCCQPREEANVEAIHEGALGLALRMRLLQRRGPGARRAFDPEAGRPGEPEWVEGQGCLPVAPWRNAQLLPS